MVQNLLKILLEPFFLSNSEKNLDTCLMNDLCLNMRPLVTMVILNALLFNKSNSGEPTHVGEMLILSTTG